MEYKDRDVCKHFTHFYYYGYRLSCAHCAAAFSFELRTLLKEEEEEEEEEDDDDDNKLRKNYLHTVERQGTYWETPQNNARCRCTPPNS